MLLAACGAPPAPAPGLFWNGADLLRLRNGAVARGEPLKFFSSPYASGTTLNEGNWEGFEVFPAFAEGQTAAYVTTEIWQGFPEVWIQPLYVPVGADGKPNGDPVFAVDATSRFYSPYWQIYTFPNTQSASYWTSAKQILDANVPLKEGPGKFCAIVPDEMRIARAQGGSPVRPLNGEPVGDAKFSAGWVDGYKVWFLDLGTNRFTWNDDDVVDETPLYHFTLNGNEIDVPAIGAAGQIQGTGETRFGALWRIWDVALPAGADVYVPSSMPALQAYMHAQGFNATPSPALDAVLGPEYILRIVSNGSCFASGTGCNWLDSEAQLENTYPPWRITKTDRLASCPLLLFKGVALGVEQ